MLLIRTLNLDLLFIFLIYLLNIHTLGKREQVQYIYICHMILYHMVCTLSNSLGWGSIHVRLQIFTEKLLWIFFQVRKNIYMFYEIELNLKSEALFFTKKWMK